MTQQLEADEAHRTAQARSHSYGPWVTAFDSVEERERITIRRQIRGLRRHPLISIVLPVYNPDRAFQRQLGPFARNYIKTGSFASQTTLQRIRASRRSCETPPEAIRELRLSFVEKMATSRRALILP